MFQPQMRGMYGANRPPNGSFSKLFYAVESIFGSTEVIGSPHMGDDLKESFRSRSPVGL